MISKDLLLITGYAKLSIINVNQYNLIRIIDVPNSDFIIVSCLLTKDIVLTGDKNKNIKQWKIERDNLKLVSIKEKAHDNEIWALMKLEDGHLIIWFCL